MGALITALLVASIKRTVVLSEFALITCSSMSAARGLEVILVGVELGNFVATKFFEVSCSM